MLTYLQIAAGDLSVLIPSRLLQCNPISNRCMHQCIGPDAVPHLTWEIQDATYASLGALICLPVDCQAHDLAHLDLECDRVFGTQDDRDCHDLGVELELLLGVSFYMVDAEVVDCNVEAVGEDAGRASEVANTQLTRLEGDGNSCARLVSVQSRVGDQDLWRRYFG